MQRIYRIVTYNSISLFVFFLRVIKCSYRQRNRLAIFIYKKRTLLRRQTLLWGYKDWCIINNEIFISTWRKIWCNFETILMTSSPEPTSEFQLNWAYNILVERRFSFNFIICSFLMRGNWNNDIYIYIYIYSYNYHIHSIPSNL